MSRLAPKFSQPLLRALGLVHTPCVGLSATQLAWAQLDSRGQPMWQVHAWDGDVARLQALLQMHFADQCVQAVLGASLARLWLHTPPSGVSSLQELHATAQARALQLFGAAPAAVTASSASAWCVSGDWHSAKPFVCVAWHGALAPLVQEQVVQFTTPLLLLLQQHGHALPANGWVACTITQELYVLRRERSVTTAMHSTRLSSNTTSEVEQQVVQEWQRQQLRVGTDEARLYWLDAVCAASYKPQTAALQRHAVAAASVQDMSALSEAQQAALAAKVGA